MKTVTMPLDEFNSLVSAAKAAEGKYVTQYDTGVTYYLSKDEVVEKLLGLIKKEEYERVRVGQQLFKLQMEVEQKKISKMFGW